MATITIKKRDGEIIEISDVELSIQQIKELAGINGHTSANGSQGASSRGPRKNEPTPLPLNDGRPDYAGFKAALSDRGRSFIEAVKRHPQGILADSLARMIGLENAVQIGGVTGGGLAKIAPQFNVELVKVYVVEKKFTNGVRQTTYKPGQDSDKL